jgi:hypothetical protein
MVFEHGIEDIGALKRELGKHQQANLAFQKALREIGAIVTGTKLIVYTLMRSSANAISRRYGRFEQKGLDPC